VRWNVCMTHTREEARRLFPPDALVRLDEVASTAYPEWPRAPTPEELRAACRDADAVVTGHGVGGDETLFGACPRLKAFVRCAALLHNVDLAAATRHAVLVLAAPPQYVRPMVELIIGLMVALSYRVFEQHTALAASGMIPASKDVGTELAGETLGIIGLGRIGRALLGQSRFVVICARLTAETRGLIDAARIAMMRPDAFLVQPAQGGIVDEVALGAALRAGRLAGAAVDVFTDEPDIRDNPLYRAPRTILTPHIGGHSVNAYRAAAAAALASLLTVLSGRVPQGVANPAVLPVIRTASRWSGWAPEP
jgi:D-3-phosphoglycerate dehydrogenase